MLGFIICVAIAGLFAAFGFADSVNTEKFKIVKWFLRPLLLRVGWKDEPGRGVIFKQSILVRLALAALVAIILTSIYVWNYGFEGENALTASPPWSVLGYIFLSVLTGFTFSYLWPGVKGGVVKGAEKAVKSAKEKLTEVQGAHGAYEHESTISKKPEKVEQKIEKTAEPVKTEVPVEEKKEEKKVDPRDNINKYLNKG
jgi:vacuolar-type H+-ATPase subunit F/Vma7